VTRGGSLWGLLGLYAWGPWGGTFGIPVDLPRVLFEFTPGAPGGSLLVRLGLLLVHSWNSLGLLSGLGPPWVFTLGLLMFFS